MVDDLIAIDGADQDLRDAIEATKMYGVSAEIRGGLREHAHACITMHRRALAEQTTRANKAAAELAMADHRLRLVSEERDRARALMLAALDERDDAEEARANAVATAEQLRGQLDRAIALLAEARDMEGLPFIERVRLKDAIDTFDAECRGGGA